MGETGIVDMVPRLRVNGARARRVVSCGGHSDLTAAIRFGSSAGDR